MTGTVKITEGPFEADHPRCLECNRPLKNPKWRKIGRGKKCYAKHCKNMQQQSQETQDLIPVAEAHAAAYHQVEGRQDRAPDPSINKASKRAALDAAFQDELAKKNPEPTEAQKKAAEQRLLQDVDKALGGEDDGEEKAAAPAEDDEEESAEEKARIRKKKAPKGQAVVRPGAFNRKGGMITSDRDQ